MQLVYLLSHSSRFNPELQRCLDEVLHLLSVTLSISSGYAFFLCFPLKITSSLCWDRTLECEVDVNMGRTKWVFVGKNLDGQKAFFHVSNNESHSIWTNGIYMLMRPQRPHGWEVIQQVTTFWNDRQNEVWSGLIMHNIRIMTRSVLCSEKQEVESVCIISKYSKQWNHWTDHQFKKKNI